MLEPLVRTLARREARRLHRGLGFGLPAVGLVMIAMAVVLAVLMLALGGRLSLGW